MNSAQRAAFEDMVGVADQMSDLLSSQAKYAIPVVNGPADLYRRWLNARNRYFELEAEAKQSRTAQQIARKGLGRKSTAGR